MESTHLEQQCDNVQRVLEQARLVCTDEQLLAHLEQFLDEYEGSTRVRPFNVQYNCNLIGVRWDFKGGFLSVLFGPGDEWSWETKSLVGDDEPYTRHLSHTGGPSFCLENKPYYYLPDEAEAPVKLQAEFTATYEPQLRTHQYRVQWVTNRYDGMLSGYCDYNNQLHYFNNVEETDFERRRVFAVYKLSAFERIAAHWKHFAWTTSSRYRWSSRYWMLKHRLHMYYLYHMASKEKRSQYYDNIHKKRQRFADSHEVVGYFFN